MFLLLQATSSFLYDLVIVILIAVATVVFGTRLASRERKKPMGKVPKIEGANRAQRRSER